MTAKIKFACGAYYEVNEPDLHDVGKSLCTMATDESRKIQRPKIPKENLIAEGLPEGSVANCLLCCPCTKKESGRRVQRVNFQGNPKACFMVTCKIKAVELDRPEAVAGHIQ